MLSDHVVIKGQSWSDWERANCRFRPSSILVYWVPLAFMLIGGWFGLAEWTWWVVWFVSVAVGAQLTEPGWRYWVALFVWPAMIAFWGLPALFILGNRILRDVLCGRTGVVASAANARLGEGVSDV